MLSNSREMKVAIVLLLAIFAGALAKNIPPTGDLFSRFEPHIRRASDQQDATKLCAIREELEKGETDSDKVRVIEFLDKMASLSFPFDASTCSKEINMEALEKTEESSEKFEQNFQETKQDLSPDVNAISFLKEFEMGDFGQDGKTVEDLSTGTIISQGLDVQSILEPIANVLASRITEEEEDDVDKVGVDNSISSTDQFECPNCKKETKDMDVFTSTMDDTEQTTPEAYKLVGMAVGIFFAVIFILAIVAFLIKSCCDCYRRSQNLPNYQAQPYSNV